MLRVALVSAGLGITLLISKYLPSLELLPFLYMLLPLVFLGEKELGFKNYKKGLLYGSVLVPLLLLLPPKAYCLSWVINQLGIAFAEEVFFRGYLMGQLGNLRTSILFSALHLLRYPSLNSLLVFFPSLLFGEVYRRSGSILAPILIHFSSNLLYSSLVEKFPQLHHLLERELTWS